MDKTEEMQRRLARLVEGNGSIDGDLAALFRWIRFETNSRIVRDVADFAAHGHERDQGFSYDGIKRVAAMLDYWVPLNDYGLPRSRAQFEAAAIAALHSDHPSEVLAISGAEVGKAEKILKHALKKVALVNGRPSSTKSASERELALLRRYASTIPLRSAFDEFRLMNDLCSDLVANGLTIREGWISNKMVGQVALFAVLIMHLAVAKLKDGRIVRLYAAHQDGTKPSLVVRALVPVEGAVEPLPVTVFRTHLYPDRCCSEELLGIGPVWKIPIEFDTASEKLQIIP